MENITYNPSVSGEKNLIQRKKEWKNGIYIYIYIFLGKKLCLICIPSLEDSPFSSFQYFFLALNFIYLFIIFVNLMFSFAI